MSKKAVSNNASAVLGERSEDALRARLLALSDSLGGDAFVEMMVALLLQSNLDRERLKQRVADLLPDAWMASRQEQGQEGASVEG